MIINKLRTAALRTSKFLGQTYGTALRYAKMFDHGLSTMGRIAHAVAPTLDKYAGTTAAHHTKQLTDDYQMIRARVMGVHNESQSVGNHLMGNIRRQVPELGL